MSYSKRLIDILLAVIGLVFIWPILLACAVAVKLSSTGPVLYLGKRTGRYSIPFKIFKFRSMREDAERTGLAALYFLLVLAPLLPLPVRRLISFFLI